MIDKTFIESVADLGRKVGRAPLLEVGHRTFLYSDEKHCYEEIERYVKQSGSVANVECLVAVVLEEAKRRGNADGSWMTVAFGAGGAFFSPDDKERLDGYGYGRVLSPEWNLITDAVGRGMKHAEFVAFLQSVSSVLADQGPVIRAFRSVDVSRVARIASSPTLTDGKAGVALAVEIAAKVQGGGQAPALLRLPDALRFDVQFARGSTDTVRLDAELTLAMIREGEREDLRFGFVIPDLTARSRDAVEQEMRVFRQGVKELPRLLILENF